MNVDYTLKWHPEIRIVKLSNKKSEILVKYWFIFLYRSFRNVYLYLLNILKIKLIWDKDKTIKYMHKKDLKIAINT